jgi:hypothetical protein
MMRTLESLFAYMSNKQEEKALALTTLGSLASSLDAPFPRAALAGSQKITN